MQQCLQVSQLGDPALPLSDPACPLRLVSIPEPTTPGKRSVVIRVAAGGLNFADVLVAQGKYQEKPKLPFGAGAEVSGTVVAVGSSVPAAAAAVGDRVCAFLPAMGAFAALVSTDFSTVVKLHPSVDLQAAAGLPIAYGTSHVALCHRCHIQPGQTVLVLGAAGGVGLAAIQIAKAVGCTVVAVARGPEKMAVVRESGADVAIDSAALGGKGALRAALKAAAPKGVDVVYDPVGGSALLEALSAVKWGGAIAVIGFASGDVPMLPANLLLVKNVSVHGVYWGSYLQYKPKVLNDSLKELAQWLAEGKIRIRVHGAFPMAEAPRAYAALVKREAIGKVLLVPPQPAKL